MDQNTNQLSVLLTTHIPVEWLDQILSSILHTEKPQMEIIIIDDAAGDETRELVQQHVQNSPNERVFLLRHDDPIGRGNALNEAFTQATGMFVWAPVKAQSFNEKLLREALRRFYSNPAAFWVMDFNLPGEPVDWLERASENLLPDDSCFIWNRKILKPAELFFNPFMTHLHGAELAMRLQQKNAWEKTDPFFVINDEQFIPAIGRNLEEFYHSAYRLSSDQPTREDVLERLKNVRTEHEEKEIEAGLLPQSHQFLAQGDAKRALQIVDKFLSTNPDHHEAVRLKISALEKLRRHVEAAELKHHLKGIEPGEPQQVELFLDESDSESEPVPEEPVEIKCSVVIPTTGLGKAQLEACLLHLEETVDSSQTELIIIDNASIDDTFEYLEQLKEDNFLNLNVITNSVNKGFGASINQGIESAKGDYVLAIHSDTKIQPNTIPELINGFEQSPDVGLTAPTINQTDHAAQTQTGDIEEDYLQTDKVDSCCFMVKREIETRFDESYGPAYFEMDDFCNRLSSDEKLIVVSTKTGVKHASGFTTGLMGLKLTPQVKWENRAKYLNRWMEEQEFEIPGQGSYSDRFERLGAPYDPANPPQEWLDVVQEFLTDEVRTDILRSDFAPNELITIVSTLLIANERELLRTLEDRLDELELPQALLVLFVHYYFEKNIYSRCKHYLKMAGDSHPIFDLYRLKIAVADKELEEASDLLNKLMDAHPCCPDLYYLAGQLYNHNGEEDEAKSFMAMANQLNPHRFPGEETAFEIKF